jgi:tetratricopeptide (TPR) repeat protein
MARCPLHALLLSAVLVALPARTIAQPPNDVEKLFVRALELQQAGDTLGAIDTYKAVLAIEPGRADALSNLGAAYVRLGQYDDAVKHYDAALASEPMNGAVRLNLALAYYKSARPQLAIPHLKRVLASDPEAKSAFLVLADCYLQTGQEREAIALLKPREQMFGADLAYAYVLGTALLRVDELVEGQKYVDRIFGAGASAEAHLLMGIAHLGRQDTRSARVELEQAVKLNPRLPTAHSLYGRTLLALGDEPGAEREFRRELDLNVNDFEANLQLGHMRRQAHRLADAAAYLERALAVRPNDLAARKLLGDLRLQTGRLDEAVAIFEAMVKEAPDFIPAHVQLATAYNRMKRPEDARRHREIVDRLNAAVVAKQKGH